MEIDLRDKNTLDSDGKPVDKAREYLKIIITAQNREINNKNFFEKHHIIPKACGGLDSNENLVFLTPAEHYICHFLLTFIYPEGNLHRKMVYAWNCMNNTRKIHDKSDIFKNSEIYSKLKQEFSYFSSVSKLGSKHWASKKVYQINPIDGSIIKLWKAQSEAASFLKLKRGSITKITSKKLIQKVGDFYWAYPENLSEVRKEILLKIQNQVLFRVCPISGNILDKDSIQNLKKEYKLHNAVITNIAKTNTRKTSKGFCWATINTLKETQKNIEKLPEFKKGIMHPQAKTLYQLDPDTGLIIDSFEYAKNVLIKWPTFNYPNICTRARTFKTYKANNFCWAYDDTLDETQKNIRMQNGNRS